MPPDISDPVVISGSGEISAVGEQDNYLISLEAGETYTISVRGTGANALEDTLIALFDTDLNLITTDDDGGLGRMSQITFTADETGDYGLAVLGFPGLGLTGDYTIEIAQQDDLDESDDFAQATEIGVNDIYYGFIDSADPGPYGPNFGEVDTFKIEAEAGKVYVIEAAGGADYASDFTDLPEGELDTRVQVYDSEGNVVAFNDDISFPSDISSAVSFFAEESGTYYIDIFSWAPWTGGYTLQTQELDPADFDPLDSIDWGTSSTIPVDENNTATVYFALAGETFGELADNGVDPLPSFGWNQTEIDAVMSVLEEYEKILGINYEITTEAEGATFRLITTDSDQYGAYFYPQDPFYGTQQGIGAFNVNSGGWDKLGFSDQDIPGDQVSLQKGGFAYGVILHEFGHAHGLAHPHDTGGGSEVMLGVAGSDSIGVYDLNQGVYTVMSYNDAWETHPDGPSPFTIAGIGQGWSGTLGAFDIAQLQAKYGVSPDHATGNDSYELKDANEAGTYYETIWDTGGTDEISYSGSRNARIDLLAATLDYTPTGGGVVSFVDDIWGGYTIANGVVIENASGGDGDDGILGNSAVNVLSGNGGDDILVGRGGGDTLDGGAGFDTASYVDAGGGVSASLASRSGTGGDAAGDRYINIEALTGSNFADTLSGGNANDTLNGLDGNDLLTGGNGNDTLDGGDGNDRLEGGNSNDVLNGGAGNDILEGGNSNDELNGGDGNDLLEGGNSSDVLNGGAGDDLLDGGNSADVLNGGAGNDILDGGNSRDTYVFEDAGEDTIVDYERGEKIDLTGFAGIGGGNVDITDDAIFVELLGDDDLTIFIEGDAVRMDDILFAPVGTLSGGGAANDIAQAQSIMIV